jgi:predicted permease
LDALLQDLRQAWRSLTRSRALALTAVLVMALGTGATTAVVSLLDELRVRPLALPHPDELYLAETAAGSDVNNSFSWPEFEDLRAATPPGTGLLAFASVNAVVTGADQARHAWGEQVNGGFFRVLGADVEQGRTLTPADDRPDAPRVLVLSHGAWRRSLGGDPNVIGRTLRLNRVPYEVVGVAGPSFHGLTRGFQPEFWIPVSTASEATGEPKALTTRRSRWLQVCARVPATSAPDAIAARLQAEEVAIHDSGRDEHALRPGVMTLVPASIGDASMLAGAARFAMVLAVLVALLLALAVANLAGLLLARCSARRRELGVRMALGAPRGRLVRQLLFESLVLSLLGGAAGLLLASPLVHLLVGFLPATYMPIAVEPRLDLRVLAVLGAVLMATGLGVGVAPAFEAGRTELNAAMRDDAAAGWWPGRRLTLRGSLVVLQVSLSFVLLVGAGLFARSLVREMSLSPGFDARGRWALTIDMGGLGREPGAAAAYAATLLTRVRALPGVVDATLVEFLQPTPAGSRMGYDAGELGLANVGAIQFDWNSVGPRYFATLGVPLVAGREFDDREATGTAPPTVVALNRTLARRLFGDADPIGRSFLLEGKSGPPATVVAVVPDLPVRNLRDAGRPCAYVPGPLSQTPIPVLVVHARDGVQPLAGMQRVARELSPEVATSEPLALASVSGAVLATARLTTWLLGAFALVALSLAGLGLYGSLAHAVARRRREIGVRMALGADASTIVRLVAGGGARLVLAGLAVGAVASALLGRAVSGMLYKVPAFDALSWTAAALTLLAAAVVAGGLPARIAARVQPAEALRCD